MVIGEDVADVAGDGVCGDEAGSGVIRGTTEARATALMHTVNTKILIIFMQILSNVLLIKNFCFSSQTSLIEFSSVMSLIYSTVRL